MDPKKKKEEKLMEEKSFDWDNFDIDDFLNEANEVGEIIVKKEKEDAEND